MKRKGRVLKILITGGAGFIGSNLARYLLEQGQTVRIFDNFATGKRSNLAEIRDRIELIEGDLRDYAAVKTAVAGMDGISHQGALGSVPRSVADPRLSHDVNVNGTLNVLEAMRETGVKRVVFAASSSAYGRHQVSPKHEGLPPAPMSPYAASKVACEAYMQGYASVFGIEAVCLRYFNVFGPRQDPNGAYAAVIPRFIAALLKKETPAIYGDGEQSRDFCYIENACLANWLALQAPASSCDGAPMNIACGRRISLNEILALLQKRLHTAIPAVYHAERMGDVRHSLADLSRAREKIGYEPRVFVEEGLARTVDWHVSLKGREE